MDPVKIGNVLNGYFEKHPVQCISYTEFEIEEYLAKKGKTYGGALFTLLFCAAMCYNYCTVYVFEVFWFLCKTTWSCLPCCRERDQTAKPEEEAVSSTDARASITQPLL